MSATVTKKTSLVKKYWMALTGLFLCIFLLGHLAGNLQLLLPPNEASIKFNAYAYFMTTNPAVKVLSYLTYFSIIFHAVNGLILSIQNKKARPKNYACSKPSKNSVWYSRNMGVLGTILLVFIVVHMNDFWKEMHFEMQPIFNLETGQIIEKNSLQADEYNSLVKKGIIVKDLYGEVKEAFSNFNYVLLYVFAMFAVAFHLAHGFKSAFQSLGLNHKKYNPIIQKTGLLFAVLVPALFAIIPLYIYLFR